MFWPPYWSVDFHERSGLQHTNGWTALDRLVDAVVADPPSRQEVAGDVDAIANHVTVPPSSDAKLQLDLSGDVPQGPIPSPEVAFRRLRVRFLFWQAAETRLLEDVRQTPRLSDAAVRAEQLGDLARVGLSSLAYLESRTALRRMASTADECSRCGRTAIRAGAIYSALFHAQAGVGRCAAGRCSYALAACGKSAASGGIIPQRLKPDSWQSILRTA